MRSAASTGCPRQHCQRSAGNWKSQHRPGATGRGRRRRKRNHLARSCSHWVSGRGETRTRPPRMTRFFAPTLRSACMSEAMSGTRSTRHDRSPFGNWRSVSAPVPAQYDRERLYEEVWSEPMKEVGRRYVMSDVALSTLCRKLEVPTPPSNHWAKKRAAQAQSPRPKLLPLGFRKRRD